MNNEDAVNASPPSHMARQQVLTNYELVSAVMSSFDCTLSTAEGRATLFKAALVCKSFTGPALDALWERIDSFIPILKLLPGLREYESSYYFHGSIVLSPFLEYAKRVRELTIPTIEEEIAFSGQVFARLAKQLNGKPLLPGLVRIRIEDVDNMASNLIPLLSSPSVSALEFRGESLARSHLHQSLFPSLDVDFPFLESLSLEDSSSSFEHHDDILPLLLKLTGLQSLEIHIPGTIVQPEFLESLGRKLPRLRHLSLDITLPHSDSVCPSGSQYGPEMFPSLESLHLTLRDGSTCHFHSSSITICSTFDPLLLSRLTSMTIFMSQPTGSVTDLKRVLLRAPNFQRLTLTQAKDDVEHDPHLEDVLSLLEIPTLEELVIDTNYIDFSDEREEETLAQILVDAAIEEIVHRDKLEH
ncbi:hypothetical protein CC1G_15632 [Coprinopsis cinerea okayama7|uniref:F-box domain-containing protein n=1 Tax=Coprinopsis cinerea (strain Okayama-7 / 130 / ATCC MYA-4618 / FGSC 9003) TaxID=240176 RepID=D6RN83_COPC7|nr:hypothetical protein CC1G_15632 [Coprinopsis cinerea okayama7\|eukprot:XP_002911090.1 hypothetical protein CC1G_15632 [Coprinopsis cinerea okayama7\